MIKENKVLVKINIRNKSHYLNLGYSISNEIEVKVDDLPYGSKIKITAVCELCESENYIPYSKYLINKNRENKGYYSCFGCKNHVKEKTCMEKWGVKSYSMTDEFKLSESSKWKGIQKGSEKGRKTMMSKYGVDSYFKTDEIREMNRKWMSSDEFKQKSKNTLINKYGVDSYSKTDDFKYQLKFKMDVTIEKIKNTFKNKYGDEYLSKTEYWKEIFKSKVGGTIEKCKETCLKKYGVDNVSKVEFIKDKIKNTKEINGIIIPDSEIDNWSKYKRDVRRITNNNKKKLYEDWDGYDYYDNEYIKVFFSKCSTHRFYPTIDHKISVYYGFKNSIDPIIVGSIDNLCITKRFINSSKSSLIESEFLLS
jgi:hypothetical protein